MTIGYGRLASLNNGTTITNAGYTSGGTYAGYDDDDNALNVQTAFLASDHSTTLFSSALSYAYNPDGSRAQMGTPAGTFSYAYDNDDRLSTLTNPFSEQSSWQYDQDSRLQSQTLGNGIVSSYAYNARSFLTDLLNKGGSTTLSEFGGSTPSTAMTYDALGDVASVKANVPAAPSSYSGTTNYQYDAKTELTQEASTRSGRYTNANSYDLAENPTQVRGVAQATANADNQIPVSGVTYDGNGNPSKVEGLTAAFDGENRATALGTVSNTWGGNGLRASKTTSGGTTYFLYDGSLPVCELSSTGSVTATNTFGGAGLISRRVGSTSTFYTFDAQGNVAQRYTSTGSLVSSDLYDAFGKGTSTGSGDVFGYEGQAGYYTDTTTGLILCGHRFYDNAAGRFINRDPIGYAGGINLYGYTGNNASNGVDPSGYTYDNNRPNRPIDNIAAILGLALTLLTWGSGHAKPPTSRPIPQAAMQKVDNKGKKHKKPGSGGSGGSNFSSCPSAPPMTLPTPSQPPSPSGLPGISGDPYSDPLATPPFPSDTNGSGQGNLGFPDDQPIFGTPIINPGVEADETGGTLTLILLLIIVVAA